MITEVIGNLIFILLLVFANGFFVAAEFAIVKVRSTQIAQKVKKGQVLASLSVPELDAEVRQKIMSAAPAPNTNTHSPTASHNHPICRVIKLVPFTVPLTNSRLPFLFQHDHPVVPLRHWEDQLIA